MNKLFLLTLSLVVSLFAHAEPVNIDGVYYEVNDETKEAKVVANNQKWDGYRDCELNPSYSGDVVIPETIVYNSNVFYVTSIGGHSESTMHIYSRGAFEGCSELISITIPKSIKTIGNQAFYGCTSLKAVYISDLSAWCSTEFDLEGLEGSYCPETNPLYYAHNLYLDGNKINNLSIPSSISHINDGVFIGADISSVHIHKDIKSHGLLPFDNCSKLKDVYIYSEYLRYRPQKLLIANPISFVFGNNIEAMTLHIRERFKDNYLTDRYSSSWIKFGNVEYIEGIDYHLIYKVDGEEYKNLWYEVGDTITPEAEPTKEGYTFSGWKNIPETMPDHDVIVIGTFAPNVYTLTYIVDNEVYNTVKVKEGEVITPEAAPTKEGYTFSGWSEIPETMPAKDVTVTGTFTINKYKLTYIVDGANYKSYEIEYGTDITPETEPTKEGYTFSGWSEIPDKMPSNDLTITGTFKVNTYKLTYLVDGEEYKSYDVDYGTEITPEENPTKEGYMFSGWDEIPQTMPAKDVTINGTFTKGAYTITYIVDGVTYKTVGYNFEDKITPEAAPEKEGYTFSGWSEIPENMPAHDITVNGTFTINKYNLIYKVDGDVYKTFEVEYASELTLEAEPTKEGYEFSGWSWLPKKMPAEDVIITGYFTQINYEVEGGTYNVDEDGATIVKGGDTEGDVVIEATIIINGKTYQVTVIGEGAYKDCTDITSLTMPDGIENILANAFNGCTGMNLLKLGKGIKHIGNKAFAGIGKRAGARTRGTDEGLVIECLAEAVPEAEADCFDGTPVETATLLVNDDLVDLYKTTSPWNKFGTIMGINEYTSGISTITSEGQGAVIYSIDGRRLDIPRKGVVIIKTDKGARKVFIR